MLFKSACCALSSCSLPAVTTTPPSHTNYSIIPSTRSKPTLSLSCAAFALLNIASKNFGAWLCCARRTKIIQALLNIGISATLQIERRSGRAQRHHETCDVGSLAGAIRMPANVQGIALSWGRQTGQKVKQKSLCTVKSTLNQNHSSLSSQPQPSHTCHAQDMRRATITRVWKWHLKWLPSSHHLQQTSGHLQEICRHQLQREHVGPPHRQRVWKLPMKCLS
jgi:hypothetical protein